MAEIINNIEGQDKLVRVSFIKGILEKMYKWIPLKQLNNGGIVQTDKKGNTTNKTSNPGEIALGQYNETSNGVVFSIGVGLSEEERKNAIEIKRDGMIYILTNLKTSSKESLQEALEKKGTIPCTSYQEMLQYNTSDNLGVLLYLSQESEYEGLIYVPGLYVIGIDAITMSPVISKLGTTSATEIDVSEEVSKLKAGVTDLTDRVEGLEDWVDNPIEKDELNNIINKTK